MKASFAKVIILLLYTAFISLLFSSNAFGGIYADSNAFFLCGKGMTEGLTPYVDFSDSKGPLLWLIFGMGYLISPHNYWGVYLFEVLFSFATLCTAYKTLRMWLNSSLSMVSTLLCGVILYYFGFHEETASETFCMPFLMISIYIYTYFVFKESHLNKKKLIVYSLLIGISISATMLIKYNMSLMIIILGAIPFIKLIKEYTRINILYSVISLIVGFISLSLPFIIYLIRVSAFIPFIEEYFLATAATVNNINILPYKGAINCLSLRTALWGAVVFFGIGCIGTFFLYEDYLKRLFLSFSFFITLLLLGINGIFPHYYEPLFVFVPILLGIYSKNIFLKYLKNSNTLYLLLVVISIVFNFNKYSKRNQYQLTHRESYLSEMKIYNAVDSVLSEKKHPKIMMYESFEGLWGLKSEAIPGCKYFIPQAGMTTSMRESINKSVNDREPDYIIVPNGLSLSTQKRFLESGYTCILELNKDNHRVLVFRNSF